jgi:FtsP/CotA-like multicopper oxidase with cupredoxin domain
MNDAPPGTEHRRPEHQDRTPLHGITVVVDTTGPRLYVGRCHEEDAERVLLMDATTFEDGQDGKTKAQWVTHVAKFGFWKTLAQVTVPRGDVTAITPLGQIPRL